MAWSIALTMVAVACGGSDDSSDGDETSAESATTAASPTTTTTTSDRGDAQPVDADVPESLEFLGDIPSVDEAHVVPFDDRAGEFTFGDGTRVDVPDGAFGATTDVLAVQVTLDFDQFAPGSTDGVAYVLSTEGDVDLAEPIHVELATDGIVQQLRDGEWETLEGSRIPIEHFSEVPTVVVEPQPEAAAVASEVPEGNSDAEFLFTCIQFLASTKFFDGEGASGLGIQLAYQTCTRALIERYEPGDVYVSTACVGDKIDGPDLRAAVDECAAEAREAEDSGESADPPPPEPEEPATPPPADGDTVVGFTGSLTSFDATLDADWEANVTDGAGSGTGVVVLTGPCTAGEDGVPTSEVIEADITATIAFDVSVTIEGDTLTVTTSGFTITDYTGQNEGCRAAFDLGVAGLGPLLDGSVGAESGPVLLGDFDGTLTIE